MGRPIPIGSLEPRPASEVHSQRQEDEITPRCIEKRGQGPDAIRTEKIDLPAHFRATLCAFLIEGANHCDFLSASLRKRFSTEVVIQSCQALASS
ncbi:MAG: hypothetical protein CMO40_04355 [Verrucomicrobiaceae bacterium]|nr:hypothetical protein [Verrucomicrobiaceae bacterium]